MSTDNRFRFTVEKLRALKPAKTAVFYDTEEQKLGIRVQPSGRRTFFLLKQVAGKPQRKSLGQFPELPIEAARRHAKSLLVELAEWKNAGAVGPSPTMKADKGMTLEEAVKLYLKQAVRARAEANGRNAEAAEDRRKKLFERYFKATQSRHLTTITTSEVEKLYAGIKEKSGPIAANRALSLLRTVYRFLSSKDLCSEDPTRTVKLFSEKARKRKRFLQPSELPKFWEALAVEKNQDLVHFVELLLSTGVRKSNLYEAKWKDVSVELATWTVPRTKNGEMHIVHLTPKALTVFKARFKNRKDKNEWVFPSESSKTGHIVDFKNQWYRLLKNAGFTPGTRELTMHDLRRTAASYQAIAGSSLQMIGEFLGHADLSSTQVYAHLIESTVRESAVSGEAMMERKRLEVEKAQKLLAG